MMETHRGKLAFYVLLMILGSSIFSQRFNFRTYSLEDGLSQSQVFCLLQDSRGYLWCGTYGGGINRFDGIDFVHYQEKDGLSDNVVNCMIEDRQGNLWLGTDSGADRYDGRTFSHYTEEDGLCGDSVWAILEDRGGHLWFGTHGEGVSRFDGKRFRGYREKDGLIHNIVHSITQDKEGHLWFGTRGGASRFDGLTFTNYTRREGLSDDEVMCIIQDRQGNMWFATTGGVNKYDGKVFTTYTAKDGLARDYVYHILENRDGHLWFATEGGASEYDGTAFTTYTTQNGLPYDFVQCIYRDREGNLWFGTDLGLSRLGGKEFTYLTGREGLPDETVWGIWEEKPGVFWLSLEKGGVKYTEKDSRLVAIENLPKDSSPYPLFGDSKGNLWYGLEESIFKYDGKNSINLTEKWGLDKHTIFSVYEDRSGNIWFGTQEGGVKRYDGKNVVPFTTKEGLAHNNVNAIGEDKWGRLIFGTDGGISIYDSKNEIFTNIVPRDDLYTRYTLCVVPDSENNLWFGTYGGGVLKYTPTEKAGGGTFDSFTTEDGLSDNEVLLMIFDDRGYLYVGTNKGINRLDVPEYHKTGKKITRYYGRYDGFIGLECQQNACLKDRKGNLWFGTVRGAIKYNPARERPNRKEPLTHITSLKLSLEAADLSPYSNGLDKRTGLPVDLELPHTRNHLTFEYIGISLTAPEKVRYRVKLDGFEDHWAPVSEATYVTYSNLPPGRYTFKVKACNNEGLWNQNPTVFDFRIIAPFWQRWWFILSGALLLGLGLFGTVKSRVGRFQRQRKILEDKVYERTLELQKEKAKVEAMNLELERRVKERTDKLFRVKEQLLHAQKMEAIGTLASGVAHDLNNILVGVVTLPEVLLQEHPGNDALRTSLLKIREAGRKAAAIVQDLLTLGKRGFSATEPVNINDVVNGYLNSPEFEKLKTDHQGIRVQTYLEDKLHSILGSAVHLNKTVMNLVVNAAEASSTEGKIAITTRNSHVEESLGGYDDIEPGEYVLLSVSDSGIGISSEDMSRIFEPFYTKKRVGMKGAGLGLAVVWGTVKDHNGYIDVQSQRGKGTVVSLYFPRADMVDTIPKELPLGKEDYRGNGQSILLVDDEAIQREIASLVLKKLGYRVTTASTGEEAVEYLKQHEVDLVVLDMIMTPGIDGCETYKRMIEFSPHQKAIIVSGFSANERVKMAQQWGAGSFIKKPYLTAEIGMAIKRELEKKSDVPGGKGRE